MLISVLNILSIVSNRLGILILYKSVYQFQPVNQKITVIPSIWDLNRINIIRITNQMKNWSSYKITQYITNNHTNWTKRMNKWMKSLFFFASQYSCGTAFLSFYNSPIIHDSFRFRCNVRQTTYDRIPGKFQEKSSHLQSICLNSYSHPGVGS